jgi:hypothetical protein
MQDVAPALDAFAKRVQHLNERKIGALTVGEQGDRGAGLLGAQLHARMTPRAAAISSSDTRPSALAR